jgi:biotin transport system substrate-specific component
MNRNALALIPLCAALTAAGAFIRVPLWPVPITLQTFFVLLSGILLGPRAGALSQLVYLLVGLMGIPVFSGGGGLAYVMKPSFGYLVGFLLAPVGVGYALQGKMLGFKTVLVASLFGTLIIYLIGIPYLAVYMRYVIKKPDAMSLAIKMGFLVFLPGDTVKCLLLAFIVPRLKIKMPRVDRA